MGDHILPLATVAKATTSRSAKTFTITDLRFVFNNHVTIECVQQLRVWYIY